MSRNNQASRDYYNHKLANHYTDYPVRRPCELLQFLMEDGPRLNRSKAKQLLSYKMVFVDNVIVTQFNAPLSKGQLVRISQRGNQHVLNSPFVSIVYEDAFLLVVDKSVGILTNTQPGMRDNSVKRILDEYVKRERRAYSVHTVHRLDRVTSGLLIFAKRRDVQEAFMNNWHNYVYDRRYVALTEGRMERDHGTVESWLSDNRMFLTYSSPTDNGGKFAVTHYVTLQRGKEYSLVELRLETGRKNQIRVHMQDIGHPIAGDQKYGAQTDPLGRVCLHAYRLEFRHPITGENLQFNMPVPPQFQTLLQ